MNQTALNQTALNQAAIDAFFDKLDLIISGMAIMVSILAIILMIVIYHLTNKILNEIRVETGISRETSTNLSSKVESLHKESDIEIKNQLDALKSNIKYIRQNISRDDIGDKIESMTNSIKKIENTKNKFIKNASALKILFSLPEVPREILKILIVKERASRKDIFRELSRFVDESINVGLEHLIKNEIIYEEKDNNKKAYKINPDILQIIEDGNITFE